MLDDRANVRIVVTDLKRGGRHDYIRLHVDAAVLRRRAADYEPLIEGMAYVLAHPPSLAFQITQRSVAAAGPQICQRERVYLRFAPPIVGFGVPHVVK
jgi:hypothetical protein